MDQLALPYRIALVALLAVAGLWFVALRPKSNSGSSTPAVHSQPVAPGVKGLTNAIAKAKNASAQSDAANARIQAATGGTTAAPATAAPATAATPAKPLSSTTAKPSAAQAAATAIPGLAAGDLSAPLLSALARHRAVVLVFAGTGSDDRSVVRAVHQLSRRHGRVLVKVAPVADVGRYTAITRGAQVGAAPTTLVIAPNREAQAIVGYTGTAELNQAISDALAAK